MRTRGFTLLEVMVALAILATSLVAISDVVGGALRNEVRARNLETAALLARGKMVSIEDHYEWKGFATSDESDDGTFEDEGHPDFKWRLEITAPHGTIDADSLMRSLTGTDLQGLLSSTEATAQAGTVPAAGAQALAPMAGTLTAILQPTLARLAENVKKGLREVRLTVSWPENGREESFEVKTHMLVLAAGETATPASAALPAAGQPANPANPAAGQPASPAAGGTPR
ncbi:MAG TPA: prepilin-type N-terminal cleavage/methylation domain-containing protein [Anaeromyxobacter sp.]